MGNYLIHLIPGWLNFYSATSLSQKHQPVARPAESGTGANAQGSGQVRKMPGLNVRVKLRVRNFRVKLRVRNRYVGLGRSVVCLIIAKATTKSFTSKKRSHHQFFAIRHVHFLKFENFL